VTERDISTFYVGCVNNAYCRSVGQIQNSLCGNGKIVFRMALVVYISLFPTHAGSIITESKPFLQPSKLLDTGHSQDLLVAQLIFIVIVERHKWWSRVLAKVLLLQIQPSSRHLHRQVIVFNKPETVIMGAK
jgi:hypothetical protein